MNTTRNIALILALAATALTPAAALASNGADDNPLIHDNHGALSAGKGNGKQAARVAGTCMGHSTSKLKVKSSNRRLETEFEVDQNRNGVTWKVEIHDNGTRVAKTNATTHAPSGSFSVERRLANSNGSDAIVATATSPSGEACTATVTV